MMLGTFSPQAEPYTYEGEEETTPAGMFARGSYSAKLKVIYAVLIKFKANVPLITLFFSLIGRLTTSAINDFFLSISSLLMMMARTTWR